MMLAMFPVQAVMYVRQAIAEERDSEAALAKRGATKPRQLPNLFPI